MYCSASDIDISTATQAQLTDDTGGDTPDGGKIDAAILSADTLIDGYCGGRYSIPFNPVPALIKDISRDIAVWNLYKRHADYDIPEGVRQRYEDAVSLLKRISGGLVVLPIVAPNDEKSGSIRSNKTPSDRIFTRDLLDTY